MSDILICGAGIVGITSALELQSRGHAVTVLDRAGPGTETSHGNAGIIQAEAHAPPGFPRDISTIAGLAFGTTNDLLWTLAGAVPLLPRLAQYFRHSAPENLASIAATHSQMTRRAPQDHDRWIKASGSDYLISRDGLMFLFHDPRALEKEAKGLDKLKARYGVESRILDGKEYQSEEPALKKPPGGGIHWPQSWSCSDPGELTRRYAEHFRAEGGHIVTGDAHSLTKNGSGWTATCDSGRVEGEHAVIALGPWAPQLLRKFGYQVPMIRKRGYHAHFRAPVALRRPLRDVDNGLVATSMARGLRILTGAHLTREAAPQDPRQLERGLAGLSSVMEIGERTSEPMWHGARPCMPDMLPLVGRAQRHGRLWMNIGHGHQGFTLAPTTAILLADLIDARHNETLPALDPTGRMKNLGTGAAEVS